MEGRQRESAHRGSWLGIVTLVQASFSCTGVVSTDEPSSIDIAYRNFEDGTGMQAKDGSENETASERLTDGQRDSGHASVGLVRVSIGGGQGFLCTGTLVCPQTVLTAGHCVTSSVPASFQIGGKVYASSKAVVHPGYGGAAKNDLSVITLEEPVTDVAPSTINVAPVRVGQPITLVGFGIGSGPVGTKQFAKNTISALSNTVFTYDGTGDPNGTGDAIGNTCNGDSGGPSFVMSDKEYVAGVHSAGKTLCGLRGYDMRVDAYVDWIKSLATCDPTTGASGPSGQPGTPPSEPPIEQTPAPESAPTACDLNPQEQELLDLVNQERVSNGLAELECEPGAQRAAHKHAQAMCDEGFFGHISPDGSGPIERVAAEGALFRALGENIALGQPTPASVHAAWMGSPGHRANILGRIFGRFGGGYVSCGGRRPFWVEVFLD